MKKNNRVYALVGLKSKMAMWNADMNMGPKSTANDVFFGSDKALKYAIKNLWKQEGLDVLYVKHRNSDFELLTLKDIYKLKFGEDVPKNIEKKGKEESGSVKVLRNILKCIDVRQFGATFAGGEGYVSMGITGVVQVGQGLNIWEDSNRLTIDILSPFKNPKKEESKATSLGTKEVVDEAHYLYPISINPNNYKELESLDFFDGYSEEDYNLLKDALLRGVTALDTNSKTGCENEFALFINLKEGSKLFLANLDSYVSMNDFRAYDISKLQEYLSSFDKEIENIEVFYNNRITSIINSDNVDISKYTFKDMYGEIIQ